ncbi:hypothetical protein [Streptomyces sp. NBC_00069]|uniref:hypothetical protein n=1 Tax=Streptomyces sp. NBC_00069 TaxID=2975639 RepID=UPI00324ED70A|nr:hypothetical protein OG513_01835 [Streptomyces sp. NBC_00998]
MGRALHIIRKPPAVPSSLTYRWLSPLQELCATQWRLAEGLVDQLPASDRDELLLRTAVKVAEPDPILAEQIAGKTTGDSLRKLALVEVITSTLGRPHTAPDTEPA